jgi:hypothetical protein
MAVPRLAANEPFFALDPDHLSEPPRKAASISGAARSARQVTLDQLPEVDLVAMGSVAVSEDGARLGKGGGFADLEFALATAAGLIGPHTICVTTVHELQVEPTGTIPLTDHDVPVDVIVTPDRVIDCRPLHGPRPQIRIRWEDLTDDKIAAIPLLSARRSGSSRWRGRGCPVGSIAADNASRRADHSRCDCFVTSRVRPAARLVASKVHEFAAACLLGRSRVCYRCRRAGRLQQRTRRQRGGQRSTRQQSTR